MLQPSIIFRMAIPCFDESSCDFPFSQKTCFVSCKTLHPNTMFKKEASLFSQIAWNNLCFQAPQNRQNQFFQGCPLLDSLRIVANFWDFGKDSAEIGH